jgi:hypothetical protein
MRKKKKPLHILDAWQRITKGRKRVDRQRRRVDRIRKEGRDATHAERLLGQFMGAQARREKQLRAVLGMLRTRPVGGQSPKLAKSAQWNARVLAFLDKQYPDAPNYKASLIALWQRYQALGLPNAHFVTEFTSGKKPVVFQRAWEMMLARHLDAQGHHLTTAAEGPDFRFEHNGLVVWVEAVSPEPMGVPDHWLEHPKPVEFKVGDVPHHEVLLRWTSAIEAKWKKLRAYRAKNIVGQSDAYVIAINGCQLGAFALQHGVSRYPYAVEAVYALGPVAIPINRDTGQFGQAFVTTRPAIQNAKGAPVPTALFLDQTYAGISGLVACSFDRSDDPDLPVDVVHNHFASIPVPNRILGTAGEEWIAESDGSDGVTLRRLEEQADPNSSA